jgi:chromate transporter
VSANNSGDASAPAGERDGLPPAPSRARLAEVVLIFLRLGFTAFGGPAAHIAMMRRDLVQRRKWLSDARFLDLLGEINLIPGPNSTQLALYLGYVRAGWPGLLLAGTCFIGPAVLIVLALAWAYVAFGAAPQAGWLLYGIKPVVIAIIAQAIWGLARTALRPVRRAALPLVALVAVFILYLLGVAPLILLFGGAIVFGLLRELLRRRAERIAARGTSDTAGTTLRSVIAPFSLAPALATLATVAALATHVSAARRALARLPRGILAALGGAAAPVSLLTLFLTFLKIGAVLYGSGYVLLAFLRADFVSGLGWLTDRQVLDAVAIGQFTPGPVFTTATFIGYLVAGVPGALLATVAIFLPSFAYVPLVHRLAGLLRRSRWTAAMLEGANVAALGLMAGVTVQLAQSALLDALTWALALVALGVLLRFKLNSAWLILAGALLGLLARGHGL